jgi:flagellar secretion chaperone FliS
MKKDNDMNANANANANVAMQQYRQNHLQGSVDTASPHRLVQMLMEGALEKIFTAKTYMANNEVAKKGETISWAISIIDGLRACLNIQDGGDIAQELFALYNYMEQRLLEANIKNDQAMLDEVGLLLNQVKSGWDNIPSEFHNKTLEH